MTDSRLASRLLDWYRLNRRDLPWRARSNPDPYAVWVSEVMLQQTRVETVIPYFEHWMRAFPTVQALAEASEQDVLNAWEGLGYYSRARNLHRASRIVAERYHGELPRDLEALAALPGIGRYTLGAIASIAFGLPVPALDGNIKRVYARVFDLSEPVDTPRGERILWELAEKHLPREEAGDFNQALMDLGSAICIPRNPRCLICPLTKLCKARRNGTQDRRPVKSPRKRAPHYTHAAAVIVRRGRVLLARRPSEGLLGGMWEFPNGRVDEDPVRGLAGALETGYDLRLDPGSEPLGIVQHGYSHFSVTVHAFLCGLASEPRRENLRWVSLKDLEKYPMGRIDRRIATLLLKNGNS